MEYFWRVSQQIVMFTPDKQAVDAEIEGWGSGFILRYKNGYYFVTCDHNVHMLDYDDNCTCTRTGIEFGIGLVCNIKGADNPLTTGMITLPDFYYFDSYDMNLPDGIDLVDITFASIPETLPLPIFTNCLCDFDGRIVVAEGLIKFFIDENAIAEVDVSSDYVITGCIHNQIRGGVRMERRAIFREEIKFTGKKYLDTYLIFESPFPIIYNDWKGLSGSPVFNDNGNLVGMLNKVVDGTQMLYVTPIHKILQFIDFSLAAKESMK